MFGNHGPSSLIVARHPDGHDEALISMKISQGRLAVAIAAILAICTGARPASQTAPILLVSMDGFRWDYCALHNAETPHLRQYAAEGISASELIPAYPSNTFPNHYSIVTGLYPAHHGIINNDFFDPRLGQYFHYALPANSSLSQWWGGEPIWVTAERQGLKGATYYWVGSEAAIGGIRPTFSVRFDAAEYKKASFESRIDKVVGWLRLPIDQRPSVVTFYLEETNSVGHANGPDSPELAAAIKLLDGRLGALIDRLNAEHLPVNLIVVSDHGMTAVSPDRVMMIDDYIDINAVLVDFQGPAMGLRPLTIAPANLVQALGSLPHARAFLADYGPLSADQAGPFAGQNSRVGNEPGFLPERLHLSGNPRIPQVWIMPEEGWEIQTRRYSQTPSAHNQKGDHGFDPAYRSMHGILIADGPSFRTGGEVIGPVENIHIYNLMCAALHITPGPNDGDNRLARAFLR
jgi:predicted AlkP superfamily pyrophosphatase or phosphodiesterase